ncbi:hypothetical protein H5410_003224 [Solanum commersonii]|uniref:DUF4283 domain-containing protein n=1 Tax=Solanum commersonii TaxID=4109 RepID=A0A9J6B4G1_SOLCO|nr:hypothetical protein H5410_003224 [Solanum commersonii]
MASCAQKLGLLPAPPQPPNPSTSDFPPLNGLTISTNPNEQIYPKDPQINYVAALGVSNGRNSKKTVKLQHRPYELLEGKPVVPFSKQENDLLAEICKLTIIGKFMRIRPSIEKIREDFSKNIPIKGSAKIGAYNMYHVFIDFDLEEDHINVYGQNFLNICNTQMKLLKWTPNFKPEAKTTLAPVWVNLPDQRWHFFEWEALCRTVAPIGVPIITDKASFSKTRPTIAKIKVEVDLTKTMVTEIQIKVKGHKDDSCRMLHPKLRKMVDQDDNKNNEKTQRAGIEPLKDSTPSHINMEVGATKRNLNEGTQTGQQEVNEANKDEEGWKTVTKGKGKNKYKKGTNPFKKSTEGEPICEKVQIIKNVKKINGQSEIEKMGVFGMTFTTQNKEKEETPSNKKGKRKVTTN